MGGLKRFVLFVLLGALFIPIIQIRYHLVREPALFGYYEQAAFPDLKMFAWKSWFSSAFQTRVSKQVNENIGFRNSLIRINNQYDFSLFRTIHADGFIAGKKGYLYEEDYILEYIGRNFIGKTAIDTKIARLKAVQEELERRGTHLLLVIEPGKASFYPEFIPDHYRPDRRSITNLDYMKRRMDALQVEYIDMNRWFLEMKDTSRMKLFPEYGMHWSISSVTLAVDSLTRYMREKYEVQIPGWTVEKMEVSDSLRGSDRDIADMLNLVFPLPPVQAAYPVIRFEPTKPTLRVISVADSYFNNIFYQYTPHLFAKTEYWYYNSSLVYLDSSGTGKVDHSNLSEKFREFDVILLMVSEINAHCGFWDFADQTYGALFPGIHDTWLYRYENKIRNNRWWFRGLVKQAAAEGTTVEQAIHRNAKYAMCVDFDSLENKTHADSITKIILDIRSIPKWLHKVWVISKERNLPIEACLKSEAEYVLSQNKR